MAFTSSTSHLKAVLEHRQTLDRSAARELLESILRGEVSDLDLSELLPLLTDRGETPAEIAGFVDAMRAAAVPYPDITAPERDLLVDTCGTGGDASGTFNISTAAALVAASAGANVAKHGNRAVTSRCGSADVLEALGIPVGLTPAQAAVALRQHRFTFLFAPQMHPAMKAVMPVRRALGVRTVFNILGPLTNPAGARRQVIGVYHPRLVSLVAEALLLLGTHHTLVIHGDGNTPAGYSGPASHSGIDELSISGPSQVAEVRDNTIRQYTLHPEDLGLHPAPLESLTGGDATLNAAILTAIFAGEPGPRRDVVLLNAAAVLLTANLAHNFPAALARAAQAIDSGATATLIHSLTTNH